MAASNGGLMAIISGKYIDRQCIGVNPLPCHQHRDDDRKVREGGEHLVKMLQRRC